MDGGGIVAGKTSMIQTLIIQTVLYLTFPFISPQSLDRTAFVTERLKEILKMEHWIKYSIN